MKELVQRLLRSSYITGYQVDSKDVKKGSLFFALKGLKTDGHLYLEEVAKKGAFGAVVSKDYKGDRYGLLLYKVENVLAFLQKLAKEALKKEKLKIIAITGSVGKTTTKEFLFTILKEKYKVSKSEGNKNSQIGLPLSILNADLDVDFLILEMGMYKENEIAKLVEIAPPDYAIVTKIAAVHIENFEDDFEGIAKAKAEILSNDKTKLAILNYDLLKYDVFKKRKYKTFSIYNSLADYYFAYSKDYIKLNDQLYNVKAPFVEENFVENLTAAIALAKELDLSFDEIKSAFSKLKLPKMRFEKFEKDKILFINDAYNANFESMSMALKYLPESKKNGKKIAVLGSMLGLGKFSKDSHEKIIKQAKERADVILCLGEKWLEVDLTLKDNFLYFSSLKELSDYLKKIMKKGDVVLLKGSRDFELEKIFDLIL